MKNTARWIWYQGDFEIYHSLLVHSRREEHGIDYPCVWALSTPYPRVDFRKKFNCVKKSKLKVISNAIGRVFVDNERFPLNEEIDINSGEHTIVVEVIKTSGLPSIYINSDYLITDRSWEAAIGAGVNYIPVGDTPEYHSCDITPETFIFNYENMPYISCEKTDTGVIFDFGKELFGNIIIKNVSPENILSIYYGESLEEATDTEYTIIFETVTGQNEYRLKSRAFRYINIISTINEEIDLSADFEYLPLKANGSFCCDDDNVKRIWDACVYTFHLNSREFYFDGIKRDRWVWSGDAYQSFMINNYLYFDKEITKRTITALLGKPPYEQHINRINDYSAYMILSVYDYYYSSGDIDYIKFIYPRLKALYDFIVSRLDDDGFVCEREGDWIFIDWATFDKEGPLCAEQILLWKAHKCMSELAELLGFDSSAYLERSNNLKNKIMEKYWHNDLGGFIDSFTTGKNHITRHANIFAILYDFVDSDKMQLLYKNVLKNEDIDQINTPFFRLFELMALCKLGNIEAAQELVSSYWGDMLKLGATTIWETYNPSKSGIEHYSMYLDKYLKSLCHAWGAGPIFLLGRYCLGVYPTDVAYKTFEVAPNKGIYNYIEGTVPIPDGIVHISLKDGTLSVTATKPGGFIINGSQKIPLLPNKETIIPNYSK